MYPGRADALALFKQYNKSESLLKHALAVEAVMRYMAHKRGGDEESWGIVGLVHDLDYEMFPDMHCIKTKEILESLNWPEEWIRGILSHGWGICTDVEPKSDMEMVLYAVDELTGLVSATALVNPSRDVRQISVKSVKKKWKSKGFAAGVDREVITRGAEMISMSIDDLIQATLDGMGKVAEELGLAGSGVEESK